MVTPVLSQEALDMGSDSDSDDDDDSDSESESSAFSVGDDD
jgi:hypothetical protein